jgi:hypothetical protein
LVVTWSGAYIRFRRGCKATTFGTLFFGGGVVSILTGSTYFRGLIQRAEQPFSFWSATIGLLVIGGLSLLGVMVCPRL